MGLKTKALIKELTKLGDSLRQMNSSVAGQIAPNRVAPLLTYLANNHDLSNAALKLAASYVGQSLAIRVALESMPTMSSDGYFELSGYDGLQIRLCVSEARTKLAADILITDRKKEKIICIVAIESFCHSRRWHVDGRTRSITVFDREMIEQLLKVREEA